jgi:transcription initiation factor TFIIH subunit 2
VQEICLWLYPWLFSLCEWLMTYPFFWQSHFKELLLEHAPPPPAIAEYAAANLIKMGFPQRGAEDLISICSCHKKIKSGAEGYICPRCKVNVCELPTECRTCGLTLVSSPHLARSYHHLFPVAPFDEVSSVPNRIRRGVQNCFGCQQNLFNPGMLMSATFSDYKRYL